MRRFLPLVGTLMLVVMLWAGNGAHAAETILCVPASAEAPGHFEGDRDQLPSDSDRGAQHHHNGCHGHHIAVPAEAAPDGLATGLSNSGRSRLATVTAGCDPGLALRPPIA
jgi:hypothetical protein